MSVEIIKSDFSKLENLIKNLKGKHYTDIGILGESAKGSNIVMIGSTMEFGSIAQNIPERSFILMPIETHQKEIIKDVEKNFQSHMEKGEILEIFKEIGISAEAVIQDAFDTGGFGSWEALSPAYEAWKKKIGKESILILEGTLRRSISSRAK